MARKSAKLNGQEYQPPYQFWHEQDFASDEQVAYGMDWLQRHLYRTLLQKALVCSNRPYLPTSDDQLWLLADAGSKERWIENKPAIMVKFQLINIDGVELWSHKRLVRDWKKLVEYRDDRAKAGRAGGLAKAEKKQDKKFVQEFAEPVSNDDDGGVKINESEV
jgi:uncharacterized protein YdaU (DUF1376 family)